MMISPSTGTLAPAPAPHPPTPSMGFGAHFGVFVGHRCGVPQTSPGTESGVPSEAWSGPQAPGGGEGGRGGLGTGGRGVGFCFPPLAGFYESFRQDLKRSLSAVSGR